MPYFPGNFNAHTMFQGFCLSLVEERSAGSAFIEAASQEAAPAGGTTNIHSDFERIFAGDIKESSTFYRSGNWRHNNPSTLCDWMVVRSVSQDQQFGGLLHGLLLGQGVDVAVTLRQLLWTGHSSADALTQVLQRLPSHLQLDDDPTPAEPAPAVEQLTADGVEEHEAVQLIRTALPTLRDGKLAPSDQLRRLEHVRSLARTLTVAIANLVLSSPWRIAGREPAYLLAEGGRPGQDEELALAARSRLAAYGAEHLDASADALAARLLPAGEPLSSEPALRQRLLQSPGAARVSPERLAGISEALWGSVHRPLQDGDPAALASALRGELRQQLLFEPRDAKGKKVTPYTGGLNTFLKKAGLSASKNSARPAFEAEALPVLARGLVPEESGHIPYLDFIDQLREQLGIVVGIGGLLTDRYTAAERNQQLAQIRACGPWRDEDELMSCLRRNEHFLEERLITAGLAKRFSDSHTEVFREHR